MPPAMLPSVTGIWFHIHQSARETCAPSNIPAGITNMLTTECSKPWAKNVRMGSHIAAILPIVDCEVSAIATPSVTIQLQRIALLTTTVRPPALRCAYPRVLASLTAISGLASWEYCATVRTKGSAWNRLPSRLPPKTELQFVASAVQVG